VSLYRSGAVNLVLNAEPDSFAQSYFLLHGVSLCALGLRSADAAAALGRATAFNSARFDGRIGPNELTIPAVRAPDGSLVYFVDEKLESAGLYAIEFDLEPLASQESAGVAGVDHVSLALPMGSLDTWVLYLRSVLGLRARDAFVLTDPHGMVRSKAMSDAEGAVRLPLNISLGRETAAARTVARHVGAGVHHIAFACTDLLSVARNLRYRDAPILEVPPNYYDDLQARHALPDAVVNAYRDLNILYDRIGDAELLHLYSDFFHDRFFFEFVQRIGGYDDYGVANAQIRMAAHARRTGAMSAA
jgi:4-hydroxyphenylpyruvate dioxygenase